MGAANISTTTMVISSQPLGPGKRTIPVANELTAYGGVAADQIGDE